MKRSVVFFDPNNDNNNTINKSPQRKYLRIGQLTNPNSSTRKREKGPPSPNISRIEPLALLPREIWMEVFKKLLSRVRGSSSFSNAIVWI